MLFKERIDTCGPACTIRTRVRDMAKDQLRAGVIEHLSYSRMAIVRQIDRG